jgi:hypothetical protein
MRAKSWRPSLPTPGQSNFCGDIPDVLINEVDLNDQLFPPEQFIELYHPRGPVVGLPGLVLVFFDGKTGRSVLSLDLSVAVADESGLIIVSSQLPASVSLPRFSAPASGVVAVYAGVISSFPVGSSPRQIGLIDAVAYVRRDSNSASPGPIDTALLSTLLSGQQAIVDDVSVASRSSIQRCNLQALTLPAFIIESPTRGLENNCSGFPSATVYINEIDLSAGLFGLVQAPFVELRTSSTWESVVLMVFDVNGTLLSSLDIGQSLGDRSTDLVVVSLSDEAGTNDAVLSLPTAIPQAGVIALAIDASPPYSSAVMMSADAIAFSRLPVPPMFASIQLWSALFPLGNGTVPSVLVDAGVSGTELLKSFSRCSDDLRRDPSSFVYVRRSPLAPNNCERLVVINEIDTVTSAFNANGEFVELYDGGFGFVSLGNYSLLAFGENGELLIRVDFSDHHRTSADGFFLVGCGLPQVDVNVVGASSSCNFLSASVGAVVLARRLISVTILNATSLQSYANDVLDAVVYNSGVQIGPGSGSLLLSVLLPDQKIAGEGMSSRTLERASLSRCDSSALDQTNLVATVPTPRTPNLCPQLLLSEVGIESNSAGFVEVRVTQQASALTLNQFALVTLSVDGVVLSAVSLEGSALNAQGIVVFGSTVVSNQTTNAFAAVGPLSFDPVNGAVALLSKSTSLPLPGTMLPTRVQLSDAIVYTRLFGGDRSAALSRLSSQLGVSAVTVPASPFGSSPETAGLFLERCVYVAFDATSWEAENASDVSPGRVNDCSQKFPVFLNEVVVIPTSPSGGLQFVELYDGGVGGTSLRGLTIAFYEADTGSAFFARSLDAEFTNRLGVWTMNMTAFPPWQASSSLRLVGAVALYTANVSDVLRKFPQASGLVDALVYRSSLASSSASVSALGELEIELLLPGESAISGDSTLRSFQRCGFGVRRSSLWGVSPRSIGSVAPCSIVTPVPTPLLSTTRPQTVPISTSALAPSRLTSVRSMMPTAVEQSLALASTETAVPLTAHVVATSGALLTPVVTTAAATTSVQRAADSSAFPSSTTRVSLCLSSPCRNNGTCIDGVGSTAFSCLCPSEFTGRFCEAYLGTSIGPEGGVLTLQGLRVVFPSGALDRRVTVSASVWRLGDAGVPMLTSGQKLASLWIYELMFSPSTTVVAAPLVVSLSAVTDPLDSRARLFYAVNSSAQFSPAYSISMYASRKRFTCDDGAVCGMISGPGYLAALLYDSCLSSPCINGGTCVGSTSNGWSCVCASGFSGSDCSANVDECASCPCLQGGRCRDQVGRFVCDCTPGTTGSRCETQVNECLSSPCWNGGTCQDGVVSFGCVCMERFTGTRCETVLSPCVSSPCSGGSTCTVLPGGSFSCACRVGTTGLRCEVSVNECASSPCVNGGCVDRDGSFQCLCAPGWTGQRCTVDVNECSSSPCLRGTCRNGIGSFACTCPLGYTGSVCQFEVNECASSPCARGVCVNGVGLFRCSCDSGFTGVRCDQSLSGDQPGSSASSDGGGSSGGGYIALGVILGVVFLAALVAFIVIRRQRGKLSRVRDRESNSGSRYARSPYVDAPSPVYGVGENQESAYTEEAPTFENPVFHLRGGFDDDTDVDGTPSHPSSLFYESFNDVDLHADESLT